jgi:hypothetical protein
MLIVQIERVMVGTPAQELGMNRINLQGCMRMGKLHGENPKRSIYFNKSKDIEFKQHNREFMKHCGGDCAQEL